MSEYYYTVTGELKKKGSEQTFFDNVEESKLSEIREPIETEDVTGDIVHDEPQIHVTIYDDKNVQVDIVNENELKTPNKHTEYDTTYGADVQKNLNGASDDVIITQVSQTKTSSSNASVPSDYNISQVDSDSSFSQLQKEDAAITAKKSERERQDAEISGQ